MSKKELRVSAVPRTLELRQNSDGTLKVSGLAIPFAPARSEDLGGFVEQVQGPSAVSRTLSENKDILLLRDHDTSKVLARQKAGTLQLTTASDGLRFSAVLQPTTLAKDTWTDLKADLMGGVSFGFICPPNGEEWSRTDDGTPLRVLTDIDLLEISLVSSWPAYPTGSAEARSRAAQMSTRSTETKTVDGISLSPSSFAYVGDQSDPSTWKLPIHFPGDVAKTQSHVIDALSRFNQTEGIPEDQKAEVYGRIVGAAKAHGITVAKESYRDLDDASDWTDPGSYADPDDNPDDPMAGAFNVPDDEDTSEDDDDEDRSDLLRIRLLYNARQRLINTTP